MSLWIQDPELSSNEACLALVQPQEEWAHDRFYALVKWDGCVHLHHVQPGASKTLDESDYLHICDLDDFIARLQELRTLAEAKFGEWPQ